MSFKFVVESRLPGGNWSTRQTLSRAEMLVRFEAFSAKWNRRYRLRHRGQDFGPWLIRPVARYRVRRRTARFDDDYRIFIQRSSDGKVLSIHKVEDLPDVPDLGCHPAIEEAYAALIRKYGKDSIRNGGIYYCRYVDGTHTVSRHGYRSTTWRGAAGDIFSTPDTMTALYEKAKYLVGETKLRRLDLDAVIVGSAVWTKADGQWHPYYGAFHRHIHMEAHSGGPCNP